MLDVILAGMILEGAGLVLLYRVRRVGVAPRVLLPTLGAGMMLLLAMRLALGGAWWGFVGAALLGALGFHALDLRRRWGRQSSVVGLRSSEQVVAEHGAVLHPGPLPGGEGES